MFKKNKRGEILIENIVFIILNVVFLSILVLFLIKQGTGVVLLEDAYSKQIALLIDSAKPGTIIRINMEKGLDVAEEKGIPFDQIIFIDKNYLMVKLSEKSGVEYSFFNDVSVKSYPDELDGKYTGIYVITISRRSNV
jgi:hypothetical protein